MAKLRNRETLEAAHGVPVALTEVPDGPVTALVRDLSPENLSTTNSTQILGWLEDLIVRCFKHLPDTKLETATAPQLAKMLDVLISNRQLLKGEPTAIVDHNDRVALNEAAKLLRSEIERRSKMKTIDGEATEVSG